MRIAVVLAVVLATALPSLSQAQAQQVPSTTPPLKTRIIGDLSFAHLAWFPLSTPRARVLQVWPWLEDSVIGGLYCHDRLGVTGSILRRGFQHNHPELRRLIPLVPFVQTEGVLEFWGARGDENVACIIYRWFTYTTDRELGVRWRTSTLGLRDAILREHAADLVKIDTVRPEGDGGRLELRDAEDNRLIMLSSSSCGPSSCSYWLWLTCFWGPYAKAVEAGR